MTNSHYSHSFTPWDGIQVEDLHDPDTFDSVEDSDSENDRGLTADERDAAALHHLWREECFADYTDDDELIAVFGADDPDNYLGESADDDCA